MLKSLLQIKTKEDIQVVLVVVFIVFIVFVKCYMIIAHF